MMRLLIADRQKLFRQGLVRLLNEVAGFTVAADTQDVAGSIEALGKSRIDIAILDHALPETGGISMIRELKARQPNARALIIALGVRDPHLMQALHAGADGYITKENAVDELITALRRLAEGRRYICPAVAEQQTFDLLTSERGQPDHSRLSRREYEVFRLLVSGMRGSEIAYELALSEKTVSTHKAHMLRKLNLRTVADLVRYAVKYDLVTN